MLDREEWSRQGKDSLRKLLRGYENQDNHEF